MITETIGFFAVLIAWAAIGFGPSLWVQPAGDRRLWHAAALAPAVGYAILGFLGFPLVRYISPVAQWTWPVTIVLVLASLAATAVYWRRERPALAGLRPGAYGWAILGASLMVLGLVCGPLLINGINYVMFRSNAADVFVPMSLTEQLRNTPWQTILGGVTFSAPNLDGIRQLAAASPTALYGVRAIGLPIALNKLITLAWASVVTGIPVYRFYFAHALTAYAMAFFLALAIGDLLKLPRYLTVIAAVVVAVGFWARFVLETDAGYEVSTIPVLMLAVYAWMRLEGSSARLLSAPRLFLALAIAGVVMFYFALIPILVAGFAVYYGLGWLQRVTPLRTVLAHGVTIALTVGSLAITGQLDYLLRYSLERITDSGNEALYPSFVAQVIKADAASAAMGFPSSTVLSALPHVIHGLAVLAIQLWASGLVLVLVVAGMEWIRKAATLTPAQRIILAMIGGELLIAVLFFVMLHNNRAAGKAFTYGYPYLVLGLATAPLLFRGERLGRLKPVATALVGVWYLGQTALGAGLPYTHILPRIFGEAQRTEDYQLDPITRYLDDHPPQSLLVEIPRAGIWKLAGPNSGDDTQWTFAYYAMYVFERYPAYFQSGLIIDNSLATQNMWLQSMKAPPDYAVILKSVDYIGPQQLGTEVAETPDLALYRLSTTDMTPLQAAEKQLFQEREGQGVCFNSICVPPGTYPFVSANP